MIKMNEETEKLLKEIKECNSLHNNCDYLLEHSDCDLLIEYVEYLEKQVCDFCLDNTKLNDYQLVLARENKQLQNNWNELKKWLEEEYKYCDKIGNPAIGCAMGQIKRIKSKMQELEQGKDE